MKYNKNVYKSLALITQFGISMLVPIGLCVALGVFLDGKFNTHFLIPLMILGMLAGGRNVYKMAMAFTKNNDKDHGGKDDHNGEG